MKKILVSVLAILGIISSLGGCGTENREGGANFSGGAIKIGDADDKFNQVGISLALYKRIEDGSDENILFSPYSALDALSLLYNASSGEVRREMEEVLGITSGQYSLYRKYDNSYLDGLQIANRVFCNEDMEDKLNLSVFGDNEVELVDMQNGAVRRINEYISDSTNDKIQNALKDNIASDTSLIAVNALYFKKKFKFEDETILWKDGNSYSGFGDKIDLGQIKEVNSDIDILKLDYLNQDDSISDYSLYVICDSSPEFNNNNGDLVGFGGKPKKEEKVVEVENVDSFMENLSEQEFEELLDFEGYAGLSGYTDATFEVPNFEMESKQSLTSVLEDLGFKEAFIPGTNGFRNLGDIHVDDVFQAAWIKTDKDGTEAAAATTAYIANASMAKRTKHVRADSTFVYIIKDNASDAIFFMGRIADNSVFD